MLITRHFAHFTADSLRVRENAKIPHADLFVKRWRNVGGSNLAVKRSVRERGRVYRCDLQNLLTLGNIFLHLFYGKSYLIAISTDRAPSSFNELFTTKVGPLLLKNIPVPITFHPTASFLYF